MLMSMCHFWILIWILPILMKGTYTLYLAYLGTQNMWRLVVQTKLKSSLKSIYIFSHFNFLLLHKLIFVIQMKYKDCFIFIFRTFLSSDRLSTKFIYKDIWRLFITGSGWDPQSSIWVPQSTYRQSYKKCPERVVNGLKPLIFLSLWYSLSKH